MSTMLLALVLFLIFPVFGSALILWAIVRVLKVPRPHIAIAFVIASIYPLLCVLVVLEQYALYEQFPAAALSIVLVVMLASLAAQLLAIRYLFAASWGKTIVTFISWGACSWIVGVATALAVRAFALGAFVVPTSAMAPTIVGVHQEGVCPHCGEKVLLSTPQTADGPNHETKEGICEACWKYGEAKDIGDATFSGDRIISNKLLSPKRWDIVTYYPPVAPGILYAHRVVGFPGESVLVKDGKLWIDGVALSPPAGLEHLRYAGSPEMESKYGDAFGLEHGVDDKPCQLAADECFILGDNTLRSSDSRFFGPVKVDQVTGVVTVLYWPPSRARVFGN